jgi:putative hydrolase of the HAD superfamily
MDHNYTVPVLLCDLDDTLFDHQHATRSALARLQAADARLQTWTLEDLKARHHILLEQYHQEVLAGRLTIDQAREQRFQALVGGGDAAGMAEAYRDAYTQDWREVDGAVDLLRAVRAEGMTVVIVTNNIVSEQRKKLDRLGLSSLIDALVTSEEVGTQKPDPRIFAEALLRVGATPADAVMLGDAWIADVTGALASGIRPVWLNHKGITSPDPTVTELRALTPTHEVVRTILVGRRL